MNASTYQQPEPELQAGTLAAGQMLRQRTVRGVGQFFSVGGQLADLGQGVLHGQNGQLSMDQVGQHDEEFDVAWEGDRVGSGQVLVEIDAREAEAQVRRAESAVREAQEARGSRDRADPGASFPSIASVRLLRHC